MLQVLAEPSSQETKSTWSRSPAVLMRAAAGIEILREDEPSYIICVEEVVGGGMAALPSVMRGQFRRTEVRSHRWADCLDSSGMSPGRRKRSRSRDASAGA